VYTPHAYTKQPYGALHVPYTSLSQKDTPNIAYPKFRGSSGPSGYISRVLRVAYHYARRLRPQIRRHRVPRAHLGTTTAANVVAVPGQRRESIGGGLVVRTLARVVLVTGDLATVLTDRSLGSRGNDLWPTNSRRFPSFPIPCDCVTPRATN